MKKMLFVFNPNSGKAQIKNELLKIIQEFSKAEYEVTVYPTTAPLDGYQHVLDCEGRFDVIACSGGDGTLNEIVGAVLQYKDKKPPIGYIPSGTTNDFATSLGIPKNMTRAAAHIAQGSPFLCDIGLANGEKNFNYVAAFGAFTEVAYATPQSLKNLLGHQAYVIEGVKSLYDLKPYKVHVITDDLDIKDTFVFGMVSNTQSVGGMKGISGNGVDLQDGLFEVMLVRQIKTPFDFQQLVTAFLMQKFDKCDMIYSFKTNKIRFESADELAWTYDGEFGGKYKKIDFEVLNKAVSFLVKKRKYKKIDKQAE